MAPKKRKTKGNKPSVTDRTYYVPHVHPTNGVATTTDSQPSQKLHQVARESQASISETNFLDGLMVTSSPGCTTMNQVDERKNMLLEMSEEQRRVAEEAITLRFDGLLVALERHPEAMTAVWEGGDFLDMLQSIFDALPTEEVVHPQMTSGSYGSSATGIIKHAKVTWAETPQPREPTRLTRDMRRSKSADPGGRHNLNRTMRLSVGSSYPNLKTPSVTERFRYNIATVTPHPKQGSLLKTSSILRKPEFGETAISMAGSPLLVSSDHVTVPSVVVPLADGRVFNVQGNSAGFREQLRNGLDPRTLSQLREIKDFINDLVP